MYSLRRPISHLELSFSIGVHIFAHRENLILAPAVQELVTRRVREYAETAHNGDSSEIVIFFGLALPGFFLPISLFFF